MKNIDLQAKRYRYFIVEEGPEIENVIAITTEGEEIQMMEVHVNSIIEIMKLHKK